MYTKIQAKLKMKSHRTSKAKSGLRIDIYMMEFLDGITRSRIQSLIKKHNILVNGEATKPSYLLKGNELIAYELVDSPKNENSQIEYENIPLKIIHEDEHIIVVDKQPGLVVHPGAGNYTGTLLNAVIERINCKSFESMPGIVHRLDKETSGVIVIAKDINSHSFIASQFEKRTVFKEYRALVWGGLDDRGTIEGNITRNNRDRKSFMLTKKTGRYSKTDYELIDTYGPISYLRLFPHTGRTHQIRVHMKSIGHPILSDSQYSGGNTMIRSFHVKYTNILKRVLASMDRVALHAKQIKFIHPATKNSVSFECDLNIDMLNTLAILKSNASN